MQNHIPFAKLRQKVQENAQNLEPSAARGPQAVIAQISSYIGERLDVVPGEEGYEDPGPKGLPAPDGTRISAHFTAEPNPSYPLRAF